MKNLRRFWGLSALCLLAAVSTEADPFALNPQVQKVVDGVSEERIRATIEKLVSFGTRNTLSNPDSPTHGVGGARQWILNEFKSYSPRLQVRFDKWHVKKGTTQASRVFKDIDLYNVVAVLPGKTMPETQVIVSGHYDSLNLGAQGAGQGGGAAAGPAAADAPGAGQPPALARQEANAELPAPGACDDGSGTAATMELARVMSQYEFDKTLVFIAFAGEEQGLVGSTLEASKAKEEKWDIEAVLNSDIIGTDISGNGRSDNSTVSIYTDETMDSPSQQLGRYYKQMAERYMPSMHVSMMFMPDRLGRGGDHTPFELEGFAAIRISTPNEIYANQHHETDTLDKMSVPYTARVARLNGAVAAALALSPKAPNVLAQGGAGRGNGQGRGAGGAGAAGGAGPQANADGGRAAGGGQTAPAGQAGGGRRPSPDLRRGAGYDAVLRWRPVGPEDRIKGYSVLIRATTSAYWEQEIFVGKVTTFTLKDVSVDDVRFGVKAIGEDGTESLVSAYVNPPRAKATYEATPIQ